MGSKFASFWFVGLAVFKDSIDIATAIKPIVYAQEPEAGAPRQRPQATPSEWRRLNT